MRVGRGWYSFTRTGLPFLIFIGFGAYGLGTLLEEGNTVRESSLHGGGGGTKSYNMREVDKFDLEKELEEMNKRYAVREFDHRKRIPRPTNDGSNRQQEEEE